MKVSLLSDTDIPLYEEFILAHPQGTFFQSIAWQKYQQEAFGLRSYIFVGKEQERIVNSALVFQHPLPFHKSYFYAPRGPVFDSKKENNDLLLEYIRNFAKKQQTVFFRFDPQLFSSEKIETYLTAANVQQSVSHQPKTTLLLDLEKSEEDILKEMKEKGRYNIRLATKKGVIIEQGTVEDMYPLLADTARRDGFRIHTKKVYDCMVNTLSSHALLLLARYEDKVIAGGLFVLYKDTMIYYYGASGNEHRNVMAPYLIQWEAIRYGKSHGAKKYDFLGIADEGVENHPWAKVTDFKLKFGGEKIEYAGAFDIAYNAFWYNAYRLYKRFRS